MPSNLSRTTITFLEAFRTFDLATFLSVLAPGAKYIIAPASASFPSLTVPDSFVEHVTSLKSILDGFQFFPKEIIENEEHRQVTIWATSLAEFKDEIKDDGLTEEEWAYKGEYVIILTMDESREKIVRVLEFVDSQLTERLKSLFARARENLKRKTAVATRSIGDS